MCPYWPFLWPRLEDPVVEFSPSKGLAINTAAISKPVVDDKLFNKLRNSVMEPLPFDVRQDHPAQQGVVKY